MATETQFLADIQARSTWIGAPAVINNGPRMGGLPDIKRLPFVKTIGGKPSQQFVDYCVFEAGGPGEFVVALPTNSEKFEFRSAIRDAVATRLENSPPAGLLNYQIVEADEEKQYVVLDAFFSAAGGAIERVKYFLMKNQGAGWTEGKISG